MKLKKHYFSVIFIVIFILASGLSFAEEKRYDKTIKFRITITNLTRGQVFSPPIAMGHDGKYRLFKLGEEASEELAALAEGGDTDPLVGLIEGLYPYAVAGDPIPPGDSGSVILEIRKRDRLRFISVAGMLVSTNDALFAARNVWFYGKRKATVMALAYDAGSEKNTEACEDIPGPPCGDPNEHPADGEEGYVHVHAGIHGLNPEGEVSSLNPAVNDWNNPVAKITIRRIYH